MAILKNLEQAIFGPHHTPVTVGNNRTIEHVGNGQHDCRLHGHLVAQITLAGQDACAAKVKLMTCGYRTVTTRAAMVDFMSAFGVSGNVSFSGGEFTLRAKRLDGMVKSYEPKTDPETIEFTGGRYV